VASQPTRIGVFAPNQCSHRRGGRRRQERGRGAEGECDARRRRRVAAEAGRVREAPFVFKGEAPFVIERVKDR
jgi:hypothetical protein